MNRGQLQRLVVSVCGLSPAFITAGIGSAMLGSPDEGLLLLGCQIFSQLLMLLLLRNAWKNCTGPVLPPPETQYCSPPPVPALMHFPTLKYEAGISKHW